MNDLIEGTFANAAGSRSYKLYLPRSRASRSPLFVMLHGCDQDADDFALGTRMNDLADECDAVVLYPEQCRLANPFGCWNWHDTKHQSAADGEPSLIAGMTRQVMVDHDIDPSRVYVAGMSAGGTMAVILAQEHPELYAAVGVHSSVPSGVASDLFSALRAMSKGPQGSRGASASSPMPVGPIVPTIVFHGDRDGTVHPSNAKALHNLTRQSARRATKSTSANSAPTTQSSTIKVRARRGADVRAFTRTRHGRHGLSEGELWMVHGGGHAWSGGSSEGTYTDEGGPDASREMVRFFLAHGGRT